MLGYLSKFRIVKKPVFHRNGVAFSTKPTSFMEKHPAGLTKSTSSVTVASINTGESVPPEKLKSDKLNSLLGGWKPKDISPYKVATSAADSTLISPAQWGNYSHMPENSICPEGFPKEIWNFYCVGAALIDSWKIAMPHEYSTVLAQSLFLPRGVGVRLTQQMFAHTSFFTKLVPGLHEDKLVTETILLNWLKFLPSEVLLTFPDYFKGNLSHLSVKTQPTLGYEFWAISKVNRDLQHLRLGFAFNMDAIIWDEDFRFHPQDPFPYEKHFPKKITNYINQTQNIHPDYVLVLDSPVTVKSLPEKDKTTGKIVEGETHPRNLVAFDLKFGPCSPSRNIVKACQNESELAEELTKIQDALLLYLNIHQSKYNSKDVINVIAAITKNLNEYNNTKNVNSFQSAYHRIYDQNVKFFLENNLGFNFIVNLPITELRIPESQVSFFYNRFRHHYTNTGIVSHFSTQISKENPAAIVANSHIAAFIKEYLTARQ